MIPALDPNPDSDFQIFDNSRSRSCRKQICITYRVVMIPALDPVL